MFPLFGILLFQCFLFLLIPNRNCYNIKFYSNYNCTGTSSSVSTRDSCNNINGVIYNNDSFTCFNNMAACKQEIFFLDDDCNLIKKYKFSECLNLNFVTLNSCISIRSVSIRWYGDDKCLPR